MIPIVSVGLESKQEIKLIVYKCNILKENTRLDKGPIIELTSLARDMLHIGAQLYFIDLTII